MTDDGFLLRRFDLDKPVALQFTDLIESGLAVGHLSRAHARAAQGSPMFVRSISVGAHSLRHAVNIAADHAKVRNALTSVEGLKGWTMAEVEGGGGVGSTWTLKYSGGPTFAWEVTAQHDDRIEWRCVSGPGDSVGTTASFALGKTPHGRVHVTFSHAGWPHQEGNFDKCNSLWGMMLHHLRAYVEKGKVAPAHS